MHEILIRPAYPGDAAATTACVREAYVKYVSRMGREPAPMNADYASLIASGNVYVIPHGADVRGVIVCYPKENRYFIDNVAVHPASQGHGLGRSLMAFAEQQARDSGHAQIWLYTNEQMTENIAYYSQLGYVEMDRRVEDGFRRVFMCKILD